MEDMLRKVKNVSQYNIEFEDGTLLLSDHESQCCESHFLDFSHLTIEDFDGLEFNLYNNNFFKKIDGYGIELIPKNGHPIRIPGYGYNNGCYSDELTLVIMFNEKGSHIKKTFDITKCQTIES